MNPDSVRDLPLICYAHDGFGILKNFLHECREQAINVSLNNNNKKSSSVSPGVVVKSWAKRFRKGSSCSGDGLKDEEKKVIKECDEENKVKDDNKDVEKGKDIGGGQMENPRIGKLKQFVSKNICSKKIWSMLQKIRNMLLKSRNMLLKTRNMLQLIWNMLQKFETCFKKNWSMLQKLETSSIFHASKKFSRNL